MIYNNDYCPGADMIQFSILYDIVIIDRLCGCQNDIQIQFIISVDIVLITIWYSVRYCVKWLYGVWCGYGYYMMCMNVLYSMYVYTMCVVCD